MANLFIFSNDLRLEDNAALYNASLSKNGLEALFLFNKDKWQLHYESPLKIKFQLNNLEKIKEELNNLNINLRVLSPKLDDENKLILEEALKINASKVFINSEYGFNEKQRDENLRKLLADNRIDLIEFDTSIINPKKIVTGAGTYFKVFTPYSRSFREELNKEYLQCFPPPAKQQTKIGDSDEIPNFELENTLKKNALKLYEPGEKAAIEILENFFENKISDYKVARDFPAQDSTSKLSVYLSSGIISAKKCVSKLLEISEDSPGTGEYSWFNEIIWREFYKYIIFHYPRVSMRKSFNEKYDQVEWRDDEEDFVAWTKGETGFPIIDAAMKQLLNTGWMHNRLRMIVAMFLSKNLLIDWKRGEEFFMQNLIDGDHASNVGGWQWSASTGVDAAPYFRIFNPITQSEKFDKEGLFLKHYLPNLEGLSSKEIHNPDIELRKELNYPMPITDLSSSRKRAIEVFSKI
ncbi:MAG: cryptochrome/photolyase family protein [Gammaproteobacteria bacterium]|jgi:deoxyribodipyrimidine photo-lyase|tara:strand:+ start:55 stop:1449 length:1395 start_codon:yes stop_codon:yes gene_type:complete